METAFGDKMASWDPLSLDDIALAIKSDPQLRTHLVTLLGSLENMALSIHANIADEAVAFETLAGTALGYIQKFSIFIEDRRQNHNSRAYDYLIELEKRWTEQLRKASKLEHPVFTNLREPFRIEEELATVSSQRNSNRSELCS